MHPHSPKVDGRCDVVTVCFTNEHVVMDADIERACAEALGRVETLNDNTSDTIETSALTSSSIASDGGAGSSTPTGSSTANDGSAPSDGGAAAARDAVAGTHAAPGSFFTPDTSTATGSPTGPVPAASGGCTDSSGSGCCCAARSGSAVARRSLSAAGFHPDIARVAMLIADPSRALMLKALGGGAALSARVLAEEAGISPATASVHLAKLVEGGLVVVEVSGRNRYHRLSGPEVSAALEALAVIACPLPVTSLRQHGDGVALRRSRLCYDHLAGELEVALMRSLIDRGLLTGHDGRHVAGRAHWDRPASYGRDVEYRVAEHASAGLAEALGVDTARLVGDRPVIRYCFDWSEEQHHLAGALGASITSRLFELGWLEHGRAARAVRPTPAGEVGLRAALGIDLTDPAPV